MYNNTLLLSMTMTETTLVTNQLQSLQTNMWFIPPDSSSIKFNYCTADNIVKHCAQQLLKKR